MQISKNLDPKIQIKSIQRYKRQLENKFTRKSKRGDIKAVVWSIRKKTFNVENTVRSIRY